MATRRKSSTLKAGRSGGFEHVDAKSTFELLDLDEKGEPNEKPWMNRIFGLTGRYATPTWRDVAASFFWESFCTALLSCLVVLARWDNSGALYIAIATVIGILVGSLKCFNNTHSLRRLLSGPLVLFYFFTGQIGLLGVACYKVAQFIGSLIGGVVLSTLISGSTIAKLPVPFPTTTVSSLTTAICLEIFVTGFLVLFFGICEFLNTDDSKREENYATAMTYYAAASGVVVLVSYQFQSWTFNDNIYLTALFSGFQKGTNSLLGIPLMAQLNTDDGYAASVFGKGGGAWANYYFGAWAGGVFAMILFWLIFFAFVDGPKITNRISRTEGYDSKVSEGRFAADEIANESLAPLINPLSRN